jgi:16S rRNA (guanine966-N2)-methyltransferase
MRIISGILKGKSINYLKNLNTRPLKDSVKENIFNILKHSNFIKVNIEKANILDLYSGIGSFGIECISRGAKSTTFVEQDKKATNILKENLIQLSIARQATVFTDRAENILKNVKKKFSIIFLDPPFADKDFIQNIYLIKKNKIYENKHIIIIHRETNTDDDLKEYFDLLFTKQYGRSKIIFGTFS